MALRYFANAPATTLSASISAAATLVNVNSVSGYPITFPWTGIIGRGTATEEVVTVTNISGTTLTVTRGADGTTAFSHSTGEVFEHGISAQDPREANAHVNATSGVHGLAGAVVGTTDSQTLTNKTISVDNNTVSGIAASSFVLSNASGNIDGAAVQKAVPSGVVVGDTDAQTLLNKTLTSPTITSPTITSPTITSPPSNVANPPGAVIMYAGSSAPSGWLLCDGSAVSRTGANAALFAAIGTTYGAGDGSTTFNLPDFQGRTAIGVGTATGAAGATAHTLGQKAGEETHTLTVAEMPTHEHAQNVTAPPSGGGGVRQDYDGDATTTAYPQGVNTGSAGGGAPHNNMQPYTCVNYIIKQ